MKIPYLLMIPFPGNDELDKFKDAWSNWITGKGDAVNQFFLPKGNPAIHFYYDHEQFFHASTSAAITISGWVQNIVYTALYGLASISSMMVQGALYLFTIIPNAIKNVDSPLHTIIYGVMLVGVALMGLMMMFYLINVLRGSKSHQIRSVLVNSMTSLVLMAAVPTIAMATGDMMTKYVIPNFQTGSTTNLADVPLRDNTVDLSTWATDGFQSKPFLSGSPNLNGLANMGIRDIPDFTSEMTAAQINQLNSLVAGNKYQNKSKTPNVKSGDTTQNSVDIKNVGNTFQYKLQASPLGDGTYTLENLDIKDGTFSFAKTHYKRYTVQNIPAIMAFVIIIGIGFLMAIKISRTVIMSYVELVGAFLQAGRDVGSSQPMKQSVMKLINTALAAIVDILLLYLFVQLVSTIPNDVANYVAGLPGGAITRPIVYVLVMLVLALSAYNGSSVLEKSFGVEAGFQGSNSMLGSMTAPGAMLGSYLGSKLANQQLNKKLENMNGSDVDPEGKAPQATGEFENQGFGSEVFADGDSEDNNATNNVTDELDNGMANIEEGDSIDPEQSNVDEATAPENLANNASLEESDSNIQENGPDSSDNLNGNYSDDNLSSLFNEEEAVNAESGNVGSESGISGQTKSFDQANQDVQKAIAEGQLGNTKGYAGSQSNGADVVSSEPVPNSIDSSNTSESENMLNPSDTTLHDALSDNQQGGQSDSDLISGYPGENGSEPTSLENPSQPAMGFEEVNGGNGTRPVSGQSTVDSPNKVTPIYGNEGQSVSSGNTFTKNESGDTSASGTPLINDRTASNVGNAYASGSAGQATPPAMGNNDSNNPVLPVGVGKTSSFTMENGTSANSVPTVGAGQATSYANGNGASANPMPTVGVGQAKPSANTNGGYTGFVPYIDERTPNESHYNQYSASKTHSTGQNNGEVAESPTIGHMGTPQNRYSGAAASNQEASSMYRSAAQISPYAKQNLPNGKVPKYKMNNGGTQTNTNQQQIQRDINKLLQKQQNKEQARLGKQQQRRNKLAQYLMQDQKHAVTDGEHHDARGDVD